MKSPYYLAAILLCSAVFGAEQQGCAPRAEHESPSPTESRQDAPTGSEQELQSADEQQLLDLIAKHRAPLPEGILEPDVFSLTHQLKDNLRCQLYIAERQKKVGTCTADRLEKIKEKFSAMGMTPRSADYASFEVYENSLDANTASELTQHLLRCVRKSSLMDWLTGLELEEQRLRIRLAGIRDFNLTHEGEQYRLALRKLLEDQLKRAETQAKAGDIPAYEPMLLREKLESWGKPISALQKYLHHESDAVRRAAEQIQSGSADWQKLLQAEELWLLGKITTAARAHRSLCPEEAALQKALGDIPARRSELTAAEDTEERDRKLRELAAEEAVLRMRLIWYPAQEGGADLVARLRQNLGHRLEIVEKQLQAGSGSPAAATELRDKLALCPQTENAAQPAQNADEHLLSLRQNAHPMVQAALARAESGQASIIDVLEAEAAMLHIHILGRAALQRVPTDQIDHLGKLEANLQRQLALAQYRLDSGAGSDAEVLALREKLTAWFSK